MHNVSKTIDSLHQYLKRHRCKPTSRRDIYCSPYYNEESNRGRKISFLAIRNGKAVVEDTKRGLVLI